MKETLRGVKDRQLGATVYRSSTLEVRAWSTAVYLRTLEAGEVVLFKILKIKSVEPTLVFKTFTDS